MKVEECERSVEARINAEGAWVLEVSVAELRVELFGHSESVIRPKDR